MGSHKAKIIEKGWWWSLVPLAGRNRFATTLGDRIYLPPKQMEGFAGQKASSVALVAHELSHARQYQQDKAFPLRYVFCPKTRLAYEVEGYVNQALSLILVHGYTIEEVEPSLERWAKYLTSWRYLWTGGRDWNLIYRVMRDAVVGAMEKEGG